MKNFVHSLTILAPESAVEEILSLMPPKALAETSFKVSNDDRRPDAPWIAESLYKEEPDIGELTLSLHILAASKNHAPYTVEIRKLPAKGWVEANQASFTPIRAGRFVLHGRKDKAALPSHLHGIEMEASAAFGTGEHPTTYGCLMALQQIPRLKRHQYAADIGTGSGVLALALARLGQGRVVATDLDAESVAVAVHNVHHNGARSVVRVVKATGFQSRILRQKKPYALIVANIFANPLASLAPAMRRHIQPGGRVVLAGFLHRQVPLVLRAYEKQRFRLIRRLRYGEWSILILQRP
jgi:ribosomal protein L11 methyltransferase